MKSSEILISGISDDDIEKNSTTQSNLIGGINKMSHHHTNWCDVTSVHKLQMGVRK